MIDKVTKYNCGIYLYTDEAWWSAGYVNTHSLLDMCLTMLAQYMHRRGPAHRVEGRRDAGKVHGDALGRGDTAATSDAEVEADEVELEAGDVVAVSEWPLVAVSE
jgi:hypothetical protein